ncbi:hypothetical protein ID0177_07130 [Helicobacter pylori]
MTIKKKEILDLINDGTRFKQTCFSSALELEKSLQEIKEAIEKKRKRVIKNLKNGLKPAKI